MTLRQFTAPTDAAVRAMAAQTAAALGDRNSIANAIPQWRRATIISNDGGSPPTCTLTWDKGVTSPGGIPFLSGYTPRAGDEVYTLGIDGVHVVVDRIKPTGVHSARYVQTGTPTLTNGSVGFITYSTKDSNGLNEPGAALDLSGLPTNTFTIPFSDWWEIEPTISWDTTVNGIGLQVQTSASKLKSNINGGAVLVDPIMTGGGKRWLAAGTLIKIQWANVTGATRTLQADSTTTPCDVIFRSFS